MGFNAWFVNVYSGQHGLEARGTTLAKSSLLPTSTSTWSPPQLPKQRIDKKKKHSTTKERDEEFYFSPGAASLDARDREDSEDELLALSEWVLEENAESDDNAMREEKGEYSDGGGKTDVHASSQDVSNNGNTMDQHIKGNNSSSNNNNNIHNPKSKIAWLMSFPNSGTSFTSLLIRHASNATTATNYGMEANPGVDGRSVPVYDWSWRGPYWLHPPPSSSLDTTNNGNSAAGGSKQLDSENTSSGTQIGKSGYYQIPPNGASILTKTHCGSRCTFCPPKKYLETWQSFLKMCLSGARSVPVDDHDSNNADNAENGSSNKKELKNANKGFKKEFVVYHPSIVEKAVHLIRNPFDNLVSRFHHEQKEHKKRKDTKWTSRYSNDVFGFRKWCADEDKLYWKEEQRMDWEKWGYSDDIRRYFEGVGCHAEFFRYVQWHNMALRVVQKLDIPVIYIYYEDYHTNLKGVTDQMLDFLNMTRVGDLPSFDSNKDYSDYFTLEERASASELMRQLVSDGGERMLKKYWVDLDFAKLEKQTQSILD